MEQDTIKYKQYTITKKFFSNEVNFEIANGEDYLFTLAPKEDTFVIRRKKSNTNGISEELINELADYIFSYYE